MYYAQLLQFSRYVRVQASKQPIKETPLEIEIEIVYFNSHHMKLTGLDFRT